MFRAVWYLIKIIVLVGLAVFLLVQPGDVVIGWMDYKITVRLGVMAVAILTLLFFVSFLSEFATRISLWPKNLARARAERRRAKGYRALLQSLSSAAIGDHKNAYYLAHRAQKFLPEDEAGLPLLLQARNGGEGKNEEPYRLLLKNADTALLGLQGLTQNAILAGDFEKALLLARQAYQANPKNFTLLKAVYDLEVRNRLWNDALVTLNNAVRHKVITRDVADHDRVAIDLALGDMAKQEGRPLEAGEFYLRAYKLDNDFVPALVRLIQYYLDIGKRHKALSLLEKSWKKQAHPAFLPLWRDLVPEQKQGQPNVKFRWFQWIAEFHPDSDVAQLALARAAIEEQIWGDARDALAKAEKIRQSSEVYELWVRLEEKTSNRSDVIRQWLDRAYKASTGGSWVCTKTGRSFSEWCPVVEPEGLFNTLIWNPEGSESKFNYGVLTKSS